MNKSNKKDKELKQNRRTKLTISERVLIGLLLILAVPLFGLDIYEKIVSQGLGFFENNWRQLGVLIPPFIAAVWLFAKLMITGKDNNKGWADSYLEDGSQSQVDLDIGNKPISELNISKAQKVHFAVYIAVLFGILLLFGFFG